MRVAITGGTGFVGGHLAESLTSEGHEVVLVARGLDHHAEERRRLPGATVVAASVADEDALVAAFEGCRVVVHCAGINREIGAQTYEAVHIRGTRNVVAAAKRAGAERVAVLSYLRARPACGSGYLESKWAAEEIVRSSGLDYLVIKSGMIFGPGDHMLDHMSKALGTFPFFVRVGFADRPVRPVAVRDVVTILRAFVLEGRLTDQTVAVVGPERMPLAEPARRVASAMGVRVVTIPMPIWLLYVLGWVAERLMKVPLVSVAQVRLLREGPEPGPLGSPLPPDLVPQTRLTVDMIRAGLPERRRYGREDLRLRLARTVRRNARNPTCAARGLAIWLVIAALSSFAVDLSLIDLLLALAPLVVVPLGLGLVEPSSQRAQVHFSRSRRLVPTVALVAVAALLLPKGALAGLLAAPWFFVTSWIAIARLVEFLESPSACLSRLLPAAAVAYLAVGAGWFVISRAGLRPLRFPEVIVDLTAVHFHFAGFAAIVIAASTYRYLRRRPRAHLSAGVAGLGLVVGMPLVALGFTFSPVLSAVGAIALGVSLALIAVVTATAVLPGQQIKPKLFLGLSSAAAVGGMVLGVQYAIGQAFGTPALGIREMAAVHGVTNGIGFVVCGLAGWSLIPDPMESR